MRSSNFVKPKPDEQQHSFGMLLTGRNWEVGGQYRYGYDGKENDDETYGNNNAVDFGARIYDARLGRWLSVDPYTIKYPCYSPYSNSIDNPILYKDIKGNDVAVSIENTDNGGRITLTETIYITAEVGYDAEVYLKLYTDAYNKWLEAGKNVGVYKENEEMEWTIEIKMNFVIATSEDIARITSAEQESASENLMTVKQYCYDPLVGEVLGDAYRLTSDNYLGYPEKRLQNGSQDAANGWIYGYRTGEIEAKASGNIALHEFLHFAGLDDWYLTANYKTLNLVSGYKGESGNFPQAMIGFENDPMGDPANGDMIMNPIHWDNLGKSILKLRGEKGNSFFFGRLVEKAEGTIPDSYCSDENTLFYDPEIADD